MFNTPILFIIFNRLETTKQVFNVIKEIKPSQLFIAADGPRLNRLHENELCNEVRNYVLNSIDWDCKVEVLFREENLGCGKAVSQAISWYFSKVDVGIILEDDCLPTIDFFNYCSLLLDKYKDDERVYHIAGQNPLLRSNIKESYYFSRIEHCWGWATWKRAWDQYSFDLSDFEYFKKNRIINSLFHEKNVQKRWMDIFELMNVHAIDTWDYQWTYTIFKNRGFCINPRYNKISNIGFCENSTHTTETNSYFSNQTRYEDNEHDKLLHPRKVKINYKLTKQINKLIFSLSFSESMQKYKSNIKKNLKTVYNRLVLRKII